MIKRTILTLIVAMTISIIAYGQPVTTEKAVDTFAALVMDETGGIETTLNTTDELTLAYTKHIKMSSLYSNHTLTRVINQMVEGLTDVHYVHRWSEYDDFIAATLFVNDLPTEMFNFVYHEGAKILAISGKTYGELTH
jgi:hypothetical protein